MQIKHTRNFSINNFGAPKLPPPADILYVWPLSCNLRGEDSESPISATKVRNFEKGEFARPLRKVVANCAPNLRKIACISRVREIVASLWQIKDNVIKFRTTLGKYPFSDAPFFEFLIRVGSTTPPPCSCSPCASKYAHHMWGHANSDRPSHSGTRSMARRKTACTSTCMARTHYQPDSIWGSPKAIHIKASQPHFPRFRVRIFHNLLYGISSDPLFTGW